MDVYGYNSYPYNSSNELANQVYAQQAFTNSCNRPNVQPHAMPAPSGAPWNTQGLDWGLQSPPPLVQFTGHPGQEIQKYVPIVHCKRKAMDLEPVIPAKQLITEEKMAAHLNGLHISSDYTSHSLSEETMELSNDMSVLDRLKGHKIELSEELKNLKDAPLLPASLIERLEKPCMSLMVWKPKENIIEKKLKEAEDSNKSQDKEDKQKMAENPRRLGVLVTDCGMDIEM